MTNQPKPLSDLPEWARHLPGYEASEAAAETAHLHARIVALEAKLSAMREAGNALADAPLLDLEAWGELSIYKVAWRKAAGEKP